MQKLFDYFNKNKEIALIHCGAGIQRTGIAAYTLLRWTGLTTKQAYDVIMGLREDTGLGVAEWRIRLAEEKLV